MTDNLPSRFGQCLRSVSLWHAHSLLGFIIGNHLAQAPSEREEGRQRRNPINLPILLFSLRFCVPCFALSHRGRFSKKLMETKLTSPSYTFTQREKIYCWLWRNIDIYEFFFFVPNIFSFLFVFVSCLLARTHGLSYEDHPSHSSARSDARTNNFLFSLVCRRRSVNKKHKFFVSRCSFQSFQFFSPRR